MFNQISKLKGMLPITNSVHEADLSTALTQKVSNGAAGLLVQAIDGDIYMAIGSSSSLEADDESFIISSSAVTPSIIEIGEGAYISFLEKDASAKVTYQFMR